MTPTPTPDDDAEEVTIGDALTAVLGGVDKTIYEVVGNEGTEGYYAATIFVDAFVAEEGAANAMVDLGVEIDIKASLKQGNAAKSAALIEIKNDGEALVSVYAKGEVFYIGQNAAGADDMTWVKLQQVDGANLINGKLAEMLFGLLADMQAETEPEYLKDEEGNYLNDKGEVTTKKAEYVQTNTLFSDFELNKKGQGFLGKKIGSVMSIVNAVGILFDVQENKTTNGTDYDISLLIEEIANLDLGGILGMIGVKVDENGTIEGLGDLGGIVDTVCTFVLGQSLTDMLAGKEATGDVPEIKIVGGLNNDGTLRKFGLSYAYTLVSEETEPMVVDIALGVKDVKVAQAANVDFAPSDAGWEDAEDVALKAEMNITVPGKNIDADVKLVLYPALDLTFAADEYVSFDFANVAGYVQVKNNNDTTPAYATIATVDQASADKGFKVNLAAALAALNIDATGLETDYFIPCDLADILNTAIRPQVEEPANAAVLDQGTIGGINTIANSVYALVSNLMNGGAFDIGAITGLIGPAMDLIEGIDVEALIEALVTEDGELNVEQVMAEAVAIIAGLDLTKDVKFSGVAADGLYAEKTLTEWLANSNVFYGIAGIVNTIIYDGSEELKATYADYEAYALSADAITAAQIVAWVNNTIGQDAFATNDLYADLTVAAGGTLDIVNNGAGATVAIKKAGVLVSISFSFSLAGENKPATGADGNFAYADATVVDTYVDGTDALLEVVDALKLYFVGE